MKNFFKYFERTLAVIGVISFFWVASWVYVAIDSSEKISKHAEMSNDNVLSAAATALHNAPHWLVITVLMTMFYLFIYIVRHSKSIDHYFDS